MWLSWTRTLACFAGGERGEILRAKRHDAQGRGPAGDQSSGDGGVVPKHKVPGKIALRVGFPRRFPASDEAEGLAGGEDYGYFASNAGDAGSSPAAGICARVV